jgi:transcriptional regulator with XRE-family HTH domain
MPRRPKKQRTELAQIIRRLRVALGDTQQQFALRLDTSITSIARYETNSTPAREVIDRMADLAREEGLPKFAELLEQSLTAVTPEPQEFAAAKELLRRRADNLQPAQLEDAVLALALLHDSPAILGKLEDEKIRIEKRFRDVLFVIYDEIEKWADDNFLSYPEPRRTRAEEAIKTYEAASDEQDR